MNGLDLDFLSAGLPHAQLVGQLKNGLSRMTSAREMSRMTSERDESAPFHKVSQLLAGYLMLVLMVMAGIKEIRSAQSLVRSKVLFNILSVLPHSVLPRATQKASPDSTNWK